MKTILRQQTQFSIIKNKKSNDYQMDCIFLSFQNFHDLAFENLIENHE